MKIQFLYFVAQLLLIVIFCSTGPSIGSSETTEDITPNKRSIAATAKDNKLANSVHCVSKVKIEFSKVYMISKWLPLANKQAQNKWKKRVTAQYGSVYSQWDQSAEPLSKCNRIGFGNDNKGNIGSTVLCEISAIPCVKLN